MVLALSPSATAMAPLEQAVSSTPNSSSTVATNATTTPVLQAQVPPPRVLARGPLWARLPALRTMTATVADSQSQAQASDSPAPPPIAMPDRVGTTRILLSDTQACVQKLSARMDMLRTWSEQSLKEVQLAREALDAGGEKTVAEIADVVYKCQASLTKIIEVQGSALDKVHNDIAKLNISSESHFRLYEMQSASLASLTQTIHTITTALQSVQVQHAQLVGMLAPLETLVRSIPMHIDALAPALEHVLVPSLERVLIPAMENIVHRALDSALLRLPRCLCMRDQVTPNNQTPRGQKRKRPFEEGMPPVEAARTRRKSAIAPPSSDAQTVHEPSSPLLDRSRSGIRNIGRLHSRGSLRQALPTSSVITEAADGTPPLQTLFRPLSRQTTRRPTIRPLNVSTASKPVDKRPRADSAVHIAAVVDAAIDTTDVRTDATCTSSGTIVTAATDSVSATARITRSAAKASAYTPMITPLRVPLGARQSESICSSADNGTDNVNKTITLAVPAPEAGSENVNSDVADKRKNDASKNKSKKQKKKGGGSTKGKRKGKKETGSAASITASAPSGSTLPSIESGTASLNPKSPPMETSPERTTTGESDSSLASVVLVHGPPNSPSTHPNSSPLPSGDANGETPEQPSISNPMVASDVTAKARTLISLMDASQESSLFLGRNDGGTEDSAGLVAALAHVDRDINFVSSLGTESVQQENATGNSEQYIGNVGAFVGFRQAGDSSSEIGSTLFNGRQKRFLVVDNESSELDLLDELFAE